MNNRETSFWVEIYDRLQGHTASLLVPLDYFVPDTEASMQTDEAAPMMNIYVLDEYSSDTWTNVWNYSYLRIVIDYTNKLLPISSRITQ